MATVSKDVIADRQATLGSVAQVIDLADIFGLDDVSNYAFLVTSSDPAVVDNAVIDPLTGILTFDYAGLGTSTLAVAYTDALGQTVGDSFDVRVIEAPAEAAAVATAADTAESAAAYAAESEGASDSAPASFAARSATPMMAAAATGESGAQIETGTAGDDEIDARDGITVVNGGAGDDTVLFDTVAPAVVGRIGGTTVIVNGTDAAILDGVEIIRQDDGTTVAVDDLTVNGNQDGSAGDEVLEATDSAPVVDGGEGDDIISGGTGTISVLAGSAADDILIGGAGFSVAVINVDYADATIREMSGYEIQLYNRLMASRGVALDEDKPAYKITSAEGVDVVQTDLVKFADQTVDLANPGGEPEPDDRIFLTDGNDNYTGTDDDEVVLGLDGDDIIDGGAGNDTLIGGAGADTLIGGAGDDTLLADAGNDDIIGGSGKDLLIATASDGASVAALGGSEADVFALVVDPERGKLDVDLIIADYAAGEDKINLAGLRDAEGNLLDFTDISAASALDEFGNTVIVLDGFTGPNGEPVSGTITLAGITPDALDAGMFDFTTTIDLDAIQGGDMPTDPTDPTDPVNPTLPEGTVVLADSDDNYTGTDGDDAVLGMGGDDILDGGAGNDILIGGAGNDTLIGGAGNDLLIADAGGDDLLGGTGDDTLVAMGDDGALVVAYGGDGADTFGVAIDGDKGMLDVDLIISDFTAGDDVVNLAALRDAGGNTLDMADILSVTTTDDTGSAVIDLSGFVGADGETVSGTITLDGIDGGSLSASMFDFTNPLPVPQPLDEVPTV